jgi:hypothetical protein
MLWAQLSFRHLLSENLMLMVPNGDIVDIVESPSKAICPLCPSLTSLHLHYRRWLRGPDKKALIVVFGDIMASRNLKILGTFNLTLSFDEAFMSWSIQSQSGNPSIYGNAELILGISTHMP